KFPRPQVRLWTRGSEFQPHGNLTRAGAPKVGPDGVGNQAEARVADVRRWITEIGVVEDIGESTLGAQAYSFRDGEGLAETAREIDGAGTDDGTDLRIAEAADGGGYRAERLAACGVKAGAGGARGSRRPSGITWAGKCSRIDPVGAAATCG